MFKRMIIALIFGFLLSFNAWASMVSFFLIETGMPENRPESQHSIQWENAFMDVFFDAGHIVSNAPVLRLETKPQSDILQVIAFNFADARSFGIDYILITMLDFTGDLPAPGEVTFVVFKVSSQEKVFERTIEGKTYRSSREEYDDLKAIARGLVPFISQ